VAAVPQPVTPPREPSRASRSRALKSCSGDVLYTVDLRPVIIAETGIAGFPRPIEGCRQRRRAATNRSRLLGSASINRVGVFETEAAVETRQTSLERRTAWWAERRNHLCLGSACPCGSGEGIIVGAPLGGGEMLSRRLLAPQFEMPLRRTTRHRTVGPFKVSRPGGGGEWNARSPKLSRPDDGELELRLRASGAISAASQALRGGADRREGKPQR